MSGFPVFSWLKLCFIVLVGAATFFSIATLRSAYVSNTSVSLFSMPSWPLYFASLLCPFLFHGWVEDDRFGEAIVASETSTPALLDLGASDLPVSVGLPALGCWLAKLVVERPTFFASMGLPGIVTLAVLHAMSRSQ